MIPNFSHRGPIIKLRVVCIVLMFAYPAFGVAQTPIAKKLQVKLDSIRQVGNLPGISVAFAFPDNTVLSLVSGYNDVEKQLLLKPTDRMLQGSVGKTYVSALAMLLIRDKKLNLEDKVSKYLGSESWFHRLPNSADITIRMLMNHSSGIMRYEFKDAFTKDLTANPDKHWKPEELLQYVLDEKAPFKAGEGWDYSDTNYILLAMVMEKITGERLYDAIRKKFLNPLKLTATFPSDKRTLAGLSQGYAGAKNDFGGQDRVINEQGLFIINPQFEWAGGGYYSTTSDLALWGKYVHEGKAFDSSLLRTMMESVPAKLGRDTRYGLGVIIRQLPIGTAYGHSGFFPGYLTEMYYFPTYRFCVAVQINSSDFAKIKASAMRCLIELSDVVIKHGVPGK